MSKKERAAQVNPQPASGQGDKPRLMTLAEARRRAFEAIEKMRQAQAAYSEEEAQRWHDYRVEE
jgi:hypothetical protein